MGGHDEFVLNVGAAGDNSLISNLPGASLFGSAWGDPVGSNSSRFAPINATMLVNLQPMSYQLSTNYLMTFAYSASSDVPVFIFDGREWMVIGTLIGDSQEYRTRSIVLDSANYFDYLNDSFGTNVLIKFGAPFQLFSVHLVAHSYSNYLNASSNLHHTGVWFNDGWSFDNGVANGTTYADIIASLARVDTAYQLEVHSSTDLSGCTVSQQTSSGYVGLGTMSYWNGIGYVQLNQGSYFDADGSNPGTQVKLRFNSTVMNVSMLRLTPNTHCTDVGASGDTSSSSHSPGVSLAGTSEWGSPVSIDGRTARYSALTYADLFVNGMMDDAIYEVNIKYKTANTASVLQCYGEDMSNQLTLALLVGDNAWHDATFRLSKEFYEDCSSEGALNILLKISHVGVYIDWINVSVDSDNDRLVDGIELKIGTNIHDADSDHDNIDDNDELRLRTDPTDPDTDRDGLLDGGERYSFLWSTDLFYSIPNDGAVGDPAVATLSLPAMNGHIEHVWVQAGIAHPSSTDLKITLKRAGSSVEHTLAMQPQGNNGAYYGSWDILDGSCTVSDLYSKSTWSLQVDDTGSLEEGRIEYFRVMVEGRTDPLKADSDGDGISDGEEVELGTDGWKTNPMSRNTDDDGLYDGKETIGFYRAGMFTKTDPTRADTDGDGSPDGIDIRPLGDAVVKLKLTSFKLDDTICELWGGIGGSTTPSTFFVLGSGNTTYFTSRFESIKDSYVSTGLQYYFNIDDNASSIDIDVQAWADNVEWGTGDYQLDIGSRGGNGYSNRIEYDVSAVPQRFDCDGISDGDDGRDGRLIGVVETLTLPRVNTIVVNGTDYGLEKYGGEYRYTADEQAFLFYLNCSDSKGQFVKGLNVIIVPRAVALASELNHTMFNLDTVGEGHPLHDASLSITNKSADMASAHVIAVISKNVTASQAEAILSMLTRDVNGDRVGNGVSVTSSQLVMMHLPLDVLNYVPLTGVQSSPIGNRPVGWQEAVFNSVVDAAEFLANGIIALGTFMLDVYVTIAEIGLSFLVKLANDVAQTVKEVAQAMVDTFYAFVDWMVDFVRSAILAPIQSLCEGIWNGLDDWMISLLTLIDNQSMDVEGGAVSQSSAVHGITAYIINSDLVKIIVAIGLAVFIAILCVQPMISPYMFVIDLVVPIIMMVILGASSAFGTISSDFGVVSGLEDLLHSFLGSSLTDVSSVILGMIFGVGGALLEFFTAAVSPKAPMIICFLLSVFGGVLAFWEMTRLANDVEAEMVDIIVSLASLTFSGLGIIIGLFHPVLDLDEKLCSGFAKLAKVTALIDFGISISGYAIVMDALAGD